MSTAVSTTEGLPSVQAIRSFRVPRGVLGLTMLFTGAAGLVYEYVLSTVFSYLLGNSIEQFSITIGLMFFTMGIGGFLQTRFKRALVELFVMAELMLVLLGGFAPIAMQWSFIYLQSDFVWIKLFYTCAIALLIGVEIPLVMRINERFTKNLGSNIASTWAWDYVGGALGVVAWVLLLRAMIPLTHISFLIASCNLVVAIMSIVFFWRHGLLVNAKGRLMMLASLVVTCALMVGGFSQVDKWTVSISQRLYDDPIVASVTTKYQNIVLTRGSHPFDPGSYDYTLWLNGNKQFSSVDEAIYHEYLVHPAMTLSARHERVLILGGGDGMALREVLKYQDVDEVTLVDLDPGMIQLASTNPALVEINQHAFQDARVTSDVSAMLGVRDTEQTADVWVDTGEATPVGCDDKRADQECVTVPVTQDVADVTVYTIDADRFLAEDSGPWDVVIVDLPDPNSIELAKLYSQEFYSKARRVLAPDGVMVVQSTSPYHAKETFLCIMRTVDAAGFGVLPFHDNVPSFGDWGWIIASPSLSADQLHARVKEMRPFEVDTRRILAENMQRAIIFDRGALVASSDAVSTLMTPVVFDLYTYEGWRVE